MPINSPPSSVVGTGLSLPFDAEPYGPGDSEYAAGQRLLVRAVSQLGARFADYLVVDSALSTAPFLHAAGRVGLHVVARLKSNLPELSRAVEKRFRSQPLPPAFSTSITNGIEMWDADDFDPWETLNWPTVRVIRYRQHKPDGSVVQADWLTDFSSRQVPEHLLIITWRRAVGRLKTRASMTPRTATGSNIFVIITPTAC